ncbi:hypothetical protein K431DRAFT_288056 [Polychaeton citri CBS 116435]|uniref:Coiled-coil domain-containing protein 16 n=1 Tax=Polychaeton citri CBS 116435 TaxID=1314669 RepID=A0A9P4PZX5_9PEZI|nr:hypothetical protein K431DRAFT_288056 [Polychaeton citri CBS 116435]
MSDARTLLRAARAERRIQHPAAQYTTSGKLLCKFCEINVKDDKKAWSSHLASTQHALRQSQADDAARLKKKRKVDEVNEDEVKAEERKRPRGADEAVNDAPEPSLGLSQEATQVVEQAQPQNGMSKETSILENDANQEAEFAALLNDFARDEEQLPVAPRALSHTATTISAAPVSAEEVAAQAREDESTQKRGRRDKEIEAEREDAAERMQNEFEEMEELETRVKKLKEMREKLRRRSTTGDSKASQAVQVVEAELPQVPEAIDEESSDEDDFDDWGFGGS